MNRITVEDPLKTQFDGLAGPVEMIDSTGRRLGHFVPAAPAPATDDCPYSPEELERMRGEREGRPLSEIWRSLGVQGVSPAFGGR
jgi:hypothetical protein